MKNQQEKIEELEGRIRFLEVALNVIIRFPDNKIHEQLQELICGLASDKMIDGWNQSKCRVLSLIRNQPPSE